MGRVGACGDNAATESFFALLQKNVLDRQCWTSREEPRVAIVIWIERTYHRRCRLGRLTPTEYENTEHRRSRNLNTLNPTSQPKWWQTRMITSSGSNWGTRCHSTRR